MLFRRRVLTACAMVLVAPLTVRAQGSTPKIPRIGYLEASMPGTTLFLDDFRQGLRELGYVEGKNVQFEVRWGCRQSWARSGCNC
jgi:putative ABC transport system substrate-binding protein